MSLTVPPFPHTDHILSPREMGALLVCGLPDEDRTAGMTLLVDKILPVKLSGIEQHPRPQRLSAVVYKELVRIISSQPPKLRLLALKLFSISVHLSRISRDATSLAIARFILMNAGNLDAEKLERWITPQVLDWRDLSVDEFRARADALRAELEEWRQRLVTDYPAEWDKYSVKHAHVQTTLDSAAAAAFDQAGGSLYEFLTEAGHTVDEIIIINPA